LRSVESEFSGDKTWSLLRHSSLQWENLKKLPEYTIGQNIVISVHHKHKCCENCKTFFGIKEVSWGGGRRGRGSVRGKKGAEIREVWDRRRVEIAFVRGREP